jgi:2-keto-3-deoxy-6-phosphogluconate aldolase
MTVNKTADFIGRVGLIIRLNSRFPVQEVIEIGDAMMAAPIPIMAISLTSLDAPTAIAELVHRFGQQMLVGADDVATSDQVEQAQTAGAQFVLSAGFFPEQVQAAYRRQLLPIPTVATVAEQQAARRLGCRLLSLKPDRAGVLIPEIEEGGTIRWLVRDGVDLHNIGHYARGGAYAVCIGGEPIPYIDWSAADLITRARQLRNSWESGRRVDGER